QTITLTTATRDRLGAAVVSRSGSLPLGYFPHSPIEPGTGGPGRPVLRAEILRGQSRDVQGAFVATINGKRRIMLRADGRTASGKTVIRTVSTVPMASMLGAASVVDAVEERAAQVLDQTLDREIDR